MGPKTSKYPQEQARTSSSTNKPTYQINARSYARWDHGAPLSSSDSTRLTTNELQNLQKHQQTVSLPVSQERPLTPSLHYSSGKSKYRYNENALKPKLGIRKSRSMQDVAGKTTLVTAEELLYGSSKSKGRKKSPSQISRRSDQSSAILKSASSSTINQMQSKTKRKKVPNDLAFVSIDPKDLRVHYTIFFNQYISSLIFHRMLEKLEKAISVLFIMQFTKELVMLQLKVYMLIVKTIHRK